MLSWTHRLAMVPRSCGGANHVLRRLSLPSVGGSLRALSTVSPPAPLTNTAPIKLTKYSFASQHIHPSLRSALTESLDIQFLSRAQQQALNPLLRGRDMLLKSRTGSGKTLACLLASIDNMIKTNEHLRPNVIPIVVITDSLDRVLELTATAQKLLRHCPQRRRIYYDISNRMTAEEWAERDVAMIIGTAKELADCLDHVVGFKERIHNATSIIVDRIDRQLVSGQDKSIDKIFQLLNPHNRFRQTMCNTAYLSKEVQAMSKRYLNAKHLMIDTLDDNELSMEEVKSIPQFVTTLPTYGSLMSATLLALTQHIHTRPQDFKVVVFFPTARWAKFAAEFFTSQLQLPVMDLYSRASNRVRVDTIRQFQTAPQGILFTTDIAATGVEVLDLSLLIHVGLTPKRIYAQRLLRLLASAHVTESDSEAISTTGSGNGVETLTKTRTRQLRGGQSLLLLTKFEESLMLTKELKEYQSILKSLPNKEWLAMNESHTMRVDEAFAHIATRNDWQVKAAKVYQSWLGYYADKHGVFGISKAELVRWANAFGKQVVGLSSTPALDWDTVSKLKLVNVEGIVLTRHAHSSMHAHRGKHSHPVKKFTTEKIYIKKDVGKKKTKLDDASEELMMEQAKELELAVDEDLVEDLEDVALVENEEDIDLESFNDFDDDLDDEDDDEDKIAEVVSKASKSVKPGQVIHDESVAEEDIAVDEDDLEEEHIK